MASNDSGSSSVLLAFILGAAAGAAIALLFAPAPGSETRRKIAEKAREGRDKAEEMAREGREFVEQTRKEFA